MPVLFQTSSCWGFYGTSLKITLSPSSWHPFTFLQALLWSSCMVYQNLLCSIHHSTADYIVFLSGIGESSIHRLLQCGWWWWWWPSILSLCVQENGEWGVKRGDRAVFPPSPLKIFPFKNIFQDLHFRRWTADRVGHWPGGPFCPHPALPPIFLWKRTNLKVCLNTRPISNHQPASSQVQYPS